MTRKRPQVRSLQGAPERVRSSVVERCPDKTEVDGSIPSAPTN